MPNSITAITHSVLHLNYLNPPKLIQPPSIRMCLKWNLNMSQRSVQMWTQDDVTETWTAGVCGQRNHQAAMKRWEMNQSKKRILSPSDVSICVCSTLKRQNKEKCGVNHRSPVLVLNASAVFHDLMNYLLRISSSLTGTCHSLISFSQMCWIRKHLKKTAMGHQDQDCGPLM